MARVVSEPFSIQRRVEFRDTDAAGIAHFSVFFPYMEEAEHAFLRSRGLSVLMHDDQGALSWPRVSVRCDYRSAVKFEDVLTIGVAITRLGSKSITYAFTFQCEGRLVADGQITAVFCRLLAGSPPLSLPIPQWILDKLPRPVAPSVV